MVKFALAGLMLAHVSSVLPSGASTFGLFTPKRGAIECAGPQKQTRRDAPRAVHGTRVLRGVRPACVHAFEERAGQLAVYNRCNVEVRCGETTLRGGQILRRPLGTGEAEVHCTQNGYERR